jgi:hypothetical protein
MPVSFVKDRTCGAKRNQQAQSNHAAIVLECVPGDPSSFECVKCVLQQAKKDLRIGQGREWAVIVTDAPPYQRMHELFKQDPKEYGWVWPRVGLLHIEMSMLGTIVDSLWSVTGRFAATCHGWATPSQQATLRSCADHHKSWDFETLIHRPGLMIAFWNAFLASPCRCKQEDPLSELAGISSEASCNHQCKTTKEFLLWGKEHPGDKTFTFLFEMSVVRAHALSLLREGTRTNQPQLRRIGKLLFAPIWFARGHVIYDNISQEMERDDWEAPVELRQFIHDSEVQMSLQDGRPVYEGLDARQEEVQRLLLLTLPSAQFLTEKRMKDTSRIMNLLLDLRGQVFRSLGLTDRMATKHARHKMPAQKDLALWVTRLGNFLVPQQTRSLVDLDGQPLLEEAAGLIDRGLQMQADHFNNYTKKWKPTNKRTYQPKTCLTEDERPRKSTKKVLMERNKQLEDMVDDLTKKQQASVKRCALSPYPRLKSRQNH